MINLNQSIAKVKAEIEFVSIGHVEPREILIEVIMHEGAGRDRKTLLAWLNEQVELLPETGYVPVNPLGEGVVDATPDAPRPDRATPVYRPELRGGVWCLYDVNNGELRSETFENKGEAKAFAERLEAGEELDEPYLHVSG